MSPWQSLLAPAIAGTGRQPFTPPQLEGPLGASLQALGARGEDAAQQLLDCAALFALAGRAGYTPAPLPAAQPVSAAAPADTQPPAPARVEGLLRQILDAGGERLLIDACQALQRAGLRLPPRLIPQALEAARRASVLRAPLAAVVGERGRWLAAQNADWRGVAEQAVNAPQESDWSHGSLAQRRAFLEQQRQTDPAAARARLEAVLKELPAKERAELLAALAIGLGAEDEALLQTLLKDRSKEVRRAASDLLLRLPEAARHARMAERLAALLPPVEKPATGGWLAGLKGRLQELVQGERKTPPKGWDITPPAEAPAEWAEDGLELKLPKGEPLGERAWWLSQLAAHTALDWWTAHTGFDAEALAAWAAKSEWSQALFTGWLQALPAHAGDDWPLALLAHGPKWMDRASLEARLPLSARETRWAARLEAAQRKMKNAEELLGDVLAACPPGQRLSPAFSRQLLDVALKVLADAAPRPAPAEGGVSVVITHTNTNYLAYTLRERLPELLCAVDLAALREWPAQLPELGDSSGWRDFAARCEFIQRARLTLHSLAETPQP